MAGRHDEANGASPASKEKEALRRQLTEALHRAEMAETLLRDQTEAELRRVHDDEIARMALEAAKAIAEAAEARARAEAAEMERAAATARAESAAAAVREAEEAAAKAAEVERTAVAWASEAEAELAAMKIEAATLREELLLAQAQSGGAQVGPGLGAVADTAEDGWVDTGPSSSGADSVTHPTPLKRTLSFKEQPKFELFDFMGTSM